MIKLSAAAFAALAPSFAFAQAPCGPLAGTVRDSTQALIPGATVTLDSAAGTRQQSGSDGRFRFACVTPGAHRLAVTADGFAPVERSFNAPSTELQLSLHPAADIAVEVNADNESAPTAPSIGGSQTISGTGLQALADDPDDLLRELQQLSSTAGGNPANATIAVDGFQDSSQLPPKSSIAYIKVNPDLFAPEYREPPFGEGRIEIYTKPGQSTVHGALFATNGSSWENARDPYSTSKAPLGKQRYGFELSGPVRRKGSDFAMTLEHRSIDNFAVVNAVTLDPTGNTVNVAANVATPQRLWLGTARTDWQLGPKNSFTIGFNASQNSLLNVGVGGTALAETGYSSGQTDNTLRFSDITTISAKRMHESRLSLRWRNEFDTPNSTAQQLQVSGAFTGGGASIGAQQLREFRMEFGDDAILIFGRHTFKVGTQFFFNDVHYQMPTNFNGVYLFGGGTVPGQTAPISGFEQYRRALLNLPGGTPTTYSNVTGNPLVDFTNFTNALFVQDDWNLPHGLHIAGGVRYFIQSFPFFHDAAQPRLGVTWSPGKRRWNLNAHAGMFGGDISPRGVRELLREDGVQRVTTTIYNPVYGAPLTSGAVPIHSIRTLQPHVSSTLWAAEAVGGSYSFPHGWNVSANLATARLWNYLRTVNINSPLDGTPTGPRPSTSNLNVLQLQNSGQGRADLEFLSIEQHSYKRFGFMVGMVHATVVADTDDDLYSGPQSSRTDAGEFARRSGSGQSPWQIFGNGTATLPYKIQWSTDLQATGRSPYNITTGFDNNGDGNFNDRPQYAAAGQPGIATPWGTLVTSGGVGVFPRNKGTLPWMIHLDMNLQRAFKLTRDAKAEHPQTVTVNLRSSNVLNHTNVTGMGGVLGSPLFGVAYAADNGRRIEAGIRYSF